MIRFIQEPAPCLLIALEVSRACDGPTGSTAGSRAGPDNNPCPAALPCPGTWLLAWAKPGGMAGGLHCHPARPYSRQGLGHWPDRRGSRPRPSVLECPHVQALLCSAPASGLAHALPWRLAGASRAGRCLVLGTGRRAPGLSPAGARGRGCSRVLCLPGASLPRGTLCTRGRMALPAQRRHQVVTSTLRGPRLALLLGALPSLPAWGGELAPGSAWDTREGCPKSELPPLLCRSWGCPGVPPAPG